jgi:Cu2+-exporting ATPase
VTDIRWTEVQTSELINIFYSLEQSSGHPLAEAIAEYLKPGAQLIRLKNISSSTGKGVHANYNESTYYAGNMRLLDDRHIVIPKDIFRQDETWSKEAKIVIYFASDTQVLAILAIADKVKPSSAKAIKALQQMDIDVYMLTGDNHQTAAVIDGQVGIKEYKAEILPDDKAVFIKQLQQQGKIVAMVGDGINDSVALAQANVSIAMGKGTDIAADAAKMILMTSDLARIPAAIRLSRKTVATVRQNLFWAFIYNLISIPIAAGILYPFNGFLLNPMIAGAAMALSSVSVVTNSLRLKRIKL